MTHVFRTLGSGLVFVWAAGLYSATATGVGPAVTEAPTGFDDLTNGFVDQTTFDTDKEEFEEREEFDSGVGPVYNAQSCAECHQTPVTGGVSQVTELRAGRFFNGVFTDHPGGSLINDRAIDPSIQEYVFDTDNVHTLRSSLNVLGDGFVEAIGDATFTTIRNTQPPSMRGQIIKVPVLEAIDGTVRIGRFGWKNQHASLLTFSGDAYVNEMGITNSLFLTENSSNGRPVDQFDGVPDPPPFGEDPEGNIDQFARFMRATKAPARGRITAAAAAGERVFGAIGCNICHTPAIVTAPAGTLVNGNMLAIPPALGSKLIRPFGDFMLHDVGTGDGIVQNGGAATRNKLRTPPLWGVRTRSRLMHDGRSLTFAQAILRHANEAEPVIRAFKNLGAFQQAQLVAFLGSL